MSQNSRPWRRGFLVAAATSVTVAITSLLTLGFMLLPDLAVLGAVIDQSTKAPDRAALDALAGQFRVTLEEQYFNWAVVSIAIGGATLWRHALPRLTAYMRAIISVGFIFAATSIILGIGYMDFMATGLSLGFTMMRSTTLISSYPSIQFFCLSNAFLLLGFSAVATTFRHPAPSPGGQP